MADKLLLTLERESRHARAIAKSDFEHLVRCLREAGDRFSDLADIIEKDRTYDPVPSLRASANRYRLEAEGKI